MVAAGKQLHDFKEIHGNNSTNHQNNCKGNLRVLLKSTPQIRRLQIEIKWITVKESKMGMQGE